MAVANTVNPVNDAEKVKAAYSKVSLSLENCILPSVKLSPSPSQLDGLDPEAEIELRILGCELIQTSGILLGLPQVAMATGQVLFQRFYYSKSFVRQGMEVVSMACVTLASKIEEAPRRIRDVINVFHHIKQVKAGRTIQPLVLDLNYINLKNQVIKAERRVLKELGFCVHVKHPHKAYLMKVTLQLSTNAMAFLGCIAAFSLESVFRNCLLLGCQIIVLLLEVLKVKNNKLMQSAWNYMNDSLRTDVFVRYDPETIACTCIALSARLLQIPLPNKPAWYLIFNVSEEDIKDISLSILSLYTRKKPDPERLEKLVDELKKTHQEAKEAKTKAKGVSNSNNQANSTSQPNSPKNGTKSPNSERKKDRSDKHNDVSPKFHKDSNHRKRRSPSPLEDGYQSTESKKRVKSSSSGSASSHSPSPKRKQKTPPRGFKDPHRSRSRSKSRSSKKPKHRSSHKRKHSQSPAHTSSTKKAYKSKHSDKNHRATSRSEDRNHHSSHDKTSSSHKSRRDRTKENHHSRDKKRR